jgi:hypothetical protein
MRDEGVIFECGVQVGDDPGADEADPDRFHRDKPRYGGTPSAAPGRDCSGSVGPGSADEI